MKTMEERLLEQSSNNTDVITAQLGEQEDTMQAAAKVPDKLLKHMTYPSNN